MGKWMLVPVWCLLVEAAVMFPRVTSSGCPIPEEKAALLELRSSIARGGCNPPASWEEGSAAADCCAWEGVACSSNSTSDDRGRVVVVQGLRLSGLNLGEVAGTSYAVSSCPLNISILNSFHGLERLDISGNGIDDYLESLDFTGLRRLAYLDLSSNNLKGRIPTSLTALPSLRILNLASNLLSGSLPAGSGAASGGLQQLRELKLGKNNLNGSLPPWLGKLTNLRHIDLSGNLLTGSIPQQAFSDLVFLEHVDLSRNHLAGNIPPRAFSNLGSLRYLDMSENLLGGSIPSTAFSDLISLECLYLSHNLLHGDFPLPSLANSSKLRELILSHNSQLGLQETNLRDLHIPLLLRLRLLALSSCNLARNFLGSSAEFLSSLQNLEVIDLSNNGLSGVPPRWLLSNNTKLQYVSLRNNSLIGEIHLPVEPLPNMLGIDLSVNDISGPLPSDIGSVLPNLRYLNLSTNHILGCMPSSFVNMSQLVAVDLSNNQLLGQIPLHLGSRPPHFLYYLRLSNNNLQGGIPGTLPPVTYLDGNKLTGTIPGNLSSSSGLSLLDVHDNQLSGSLPSSIGDHPTLKALVLRGNRLHGHIPPRLCDLRMLRLLDLSHNNFSGVVPGCPTPLGLTYLNLAGNALQGTFPHSFVDPSWLVSLNARKNQFSGPLPSWFGDLTNIRILLLSQNRFEGPIPTQICKLQQLQLLDLSQNKFSGSIPPCIGNVGVKLQIAEEQFPRPFWKLYPGVLFGASMTSGLYASTRANSIGSLSFVLILDLEEVEFFTKGNPYYYRGKPLSWMIGIDLSSNRLTGEIPPEIGNLTMIKALNFSHNQMVGHIPATLSKLKQIESLDLSHNHLNGTIPRQLIELNFLAVFSVAHNDLSGCTVEFSGQFATFGVRSYEGNEGLHGPPLDTSCAPGSSPWNNLFSRRKEEEDVGVLRLPLCYPFG